MAVKKIKLPDNSTQDIYDARITGIDSSPTTSSTNVVTSGGVATAIGNIEHFYFVQGSSSAAGSSTSGSYLSVKWEGTIPGVSAAYNGLKIAYRIATRTGVSGGGVVLSIDGTHYYPVVIQKNTMVTTHYPVGATILAVFNSTQTATAYLTAGSKSTVTGCWQIMEYDSNTNTYQREYVSSDNTEYAITTRYNTTSGESYYAEYGRYSEGVTLNPSTNAITASKFKVTGGTSSQFLKADGSVDSTSYGTYSKPSGGIPSTDLSSGVQTSLGKADTALQSFTEADPIFSASAAAGITSIDITGWNNKVSNVQSDWNATSGLAVILNKPSIPSAPGTLNTTATTAQSTAASEALSGSITLHKVAKTGTYGDLIGTPTIPSAPGTLNTTATTAQSTAASEALSGSVTLHKVAKTGTYSDLIGTPTIPSAPGTIVTNNTSAQTASASEALSGTINLHKVSKTGTYSDLIGTPTIPDTSTVAGWGYVKYQLCADEAAYEAIQNKDSGTLYLIPET